MLKGRSISRPMLPVVTDSEEIALRQLENAIEAYQDREESAVYCELVAVADIETLKAEFEELLPYARTIIWEKLDDVLEKRFLSGISRNSAVYREIYQDAWCWAWKIFAFELRPDRTAKKRMQYAAYSGCKRALSGRQWKVTESMVNDRTISQSDLHPNPDTAEFIVDQLFSGAGDGEPSAEDIVNSAEMVDMVYSKFGTSAEKMDVYRELFDPRQLVDIVGEPAVIVSLIIDGFGLTEIAQQLGYQTKFNVSKAVKDLKDEFQLAVCMDEIKDKLLWSLTVKEIIDWSHRTANQTV